MNKQLRWFEAVADCEQRGEPYVLVTVVGVAGSVPREPSSKMVITGEHTWDTIGGGHLEYLVTARAREQLAAGRFETVLEHFPLGASLGQCCGGSVSVLLEGQPGSDAQLVVFGAGHVAQALMAIMGQLPWQVTLVDSRAELLRIPRSREVHQSYLTSVWTSLRSLLACFPLLTRRGPFSLLLTNGPGTALPLPVALRWAALESSPSASPVTP